MIHQKQLLAGVDAGLLAALEDFHWGLSKWYNIQVWKGHFDAVHGNLLKSGKGVMFTVQRSGATIHAKANKDIKDVLAWFGENYPAFEVLVIEKEKFDVFLLKGKVTAPAPELKPEPQWNAIDAMGLANEPETV